MEFPKLVCITSPETDRPAPAIMAERTLGIRIFQIILVSAGLLFLARAAIDWWNDIWEDPIKTHTKANSNNKMVIQIRIFNLFRFA
jgi:hypothetical protein